MLYGDIDIVEKFHIMALLEYDVVRDDHLAQSLLQVSLLSGTYLSSLSYFRGDSHFLDSCYWVS